MDIAESNKLIDLWMAEFEEYESDRLNIINDLEVKGFEPRRYNEEWDLLMPVCKKLDFLVEDGIIPGSTEYIKLCTKMDDAVTRAYDIEQAYPVVVEFIQWCNENK